MKLKIMKVLIFVVISNFFVSQLYAKKEIRSLGGKHFNYVGCDNDSAAWLEPDEAAIFYFTNKIANVSLSKKILEIEMYSNKDFKGLPEVKLNKDGLYIKQVKRCSWLIEDRQHDNKTYDYDFNVGFLAKYNLKDKKTEELTCDVKGTAEYGFIVTAKTDKYYEVELDNAKYYINAKTNPDVKYVRSQNSISEEYLKKFYDQFNPSFKENQKKFIDYVEMNKKCYETNSSDKSCELNKVPIWFVNYMCFSGEVKCPDKISKWKLTKKMQDIYKKNLSQCFDYKNMKMLLSELSTDDRRHSNLDLSIPIKYATIFTRVEGYIDDIFCNYRIKFNNTNIEKISAFLDLTISYPGELIENEDLDPDRAESYNQEMVRSERTDKCRIEEQPKNIISVSEIGDRNAKELGKKP